MIDINPPLRIIPIHLINPQANKEKSLHIGEELESLILTLGGEIVERVVQKRDHPDNATFIGKGKVEELIKIITDIDADVIVLNTRAKPNQIHSLQKALQKVRPTIEVWDRVDLILQIFDKHATTTESKLQIELARMQYMGPRIYGMGFIMSRQGGGIGTVGIGETNTELMKRHWRSEIKKVREQLTKINKLKEIQLMHRKRASLKTVSIVGYTNAGKSSLFNVLTGKNNLVKDVLFATLDSTVGKVYFPQLKSDILITDTIGFIRNLPPHLISAFKSTLMESLHADILLQIIDASDPEMHSKISAVNEILRELSRSTQDVIYVFNKIDKIKELKKDELLEAYSSNNPHFISVKSGEGLERLQQTIATNLLNQQQTS